MVLQNSEPMLRFNLSFKYRPLGYKNGISLGAVQGSLVFLRYFLNAAFNSGASLSTWNSRKSEDYNSFNANYQYFFKKWAIAGLFFVFRLLDIVYSKQMFYIKVCRWLDSNCWPLALEAAGLPTEPQPLPNHHYLFALLHLPQKY